MKLPPIANDLNTSPEPLSAEYGLDLQEIDDLLQRSARRTSIPRELADNVYDVTVGLLLKRLDPIPLASRRETAWTRLAMAASLGLAFLVAALFMRVPAQAAHSPSASTVSILEVERLFVEPSVDYLLETRDITYTDLLSDLDCIEREMEL